MIFPHSSYCIPFVKDQSRFYEIHCLAIYINIKEFNRVCKKQLNILKIFLEYLDFICLFPEDDSALKVAQQITFRGLVAYKLVAYKKKKVYRKKRNKHLKWNFSFPSFQSAQSDNQKRKWQKYMGHDFKQSRMSMNSLLETGAMTEV